MIYIKDRNKIELYYLIVLLNIFFLAVIIMTSLILTRRININIVIVVVVNCILTLYITTALYSYRLFGVNRKYYLFVPILVFLEAIIDNVLIALHLLNILYILRLVSYFLLLLPIFINKKKYEKDSLEWNMQKITKITVITFLAFMILFIPFSESIFEKTYFSMLFCGAFAMLYQIPGLLYCKKRLFGTGSLFSKTGMESLTKRENDVALAICNGYKYEEIAQKMCISLSTVKKHSFNLYRKLGINNNRELMQLIMESQKTDAHEPKQ